MKVLQMQLITLKCMFWYFKKMEQVNTSQENIISLSLPNFF